MKKRSNKVKCPICLQVGYLGLDKGKVFRVTHNVKIKTGVWKPIHHNLGSIDSAMKRLEAVSQIRDDLMPPALLLMIKEWKLSKLGKTGKKTPEESELEILTWILYLAKKLGPGWKKKTHHLTKQDTCKHCGKQIQYRFTRIGEEPELYNIKEFGIEKGSNIKTSWMRIGEQV